jgi:uncharacterized paraquat-inducible protein A
MPRFSEESNDLDDSEYPEPDDGDGDDATDVCPYCQADIYEDAVRCPRCERYLSQEDAPSSRPRWVMATALVCLLIVLWWAFGF